MRGKETLTINPIVCSAVMLRRLFTGVGQMRDLTREGPATEATDILDVFQQVKLNNPHIYYSVKG